MKKVMMFCLMALMATSAQAAISSVTGDCVDAGSAAVVDLSSNSTTSYDDISVFAEQQGVVLGADLTLDEGGTIPAGTIVNSYIAHMDVENVENPYTQFTGSVTFDGPVLGVIYQEVPLAATDTILGNALGYHNPRRLNLDAVGYPYDAYTLTGNTLSLDCYTGGGIDEIRIIEELVPTIEKDFHADNLGPDPIGISLYDTTTYVLEITYSGPAALIQDTVPAEFKVFSVDASAGTAKALSANKGSKANKSATIITWDVPVGVGSTLKITIKTRLSPGKGHAKKGPRIHKPTSCGPLELNDGATAYEPDGQGGIALDGFGEPIIIAGPSDYKEVEAVCGSKPCAPDLTIQFTPGDPVTVSLDWDEVCDFQGADTVVYNVYRDGVLLNTEPLEDSEYEDSLTAVAGVKYCYKVVAKYTTGAYVGNTSEAEVCITPIQL